MSKITKAVIPIAGLGKRMLPLSAAVPKALLGLVDGAGRCRAVLHWIAAQAAAAGASELAIVMSPSQEAMVRAYLSAARGAEPAMPANITLIVQDRPAGFGDAVLRARQFVGGESFLLLLGDHVYAGGSGVPAAAQVVGAMEQVGRLTAALRTEGLTAPLQADGLTAALPAEGLTAPLQADGLTAPLQTAAMIGVQQVGAEELSRVGVCAGEPVNLPDEQAADGSNPPRNRVYRCTAFVEKPSAAQARQSLRTPPLPDGEFLAHAGIYVFTSEIFDCLAELAAGVTPDSGAMPSPSSSSRRSRSLAEPDGEGMRSCACLPVNGSGRHATRELQLADAQSLLLSRHPRDYYLCHIDATACDVGTPEGYAAAVKRFRGSQ